MMKKFLNMLMVSAMLMGAVAFGQDVTTEALAASTESGSALAGAGFDLLAWLIPIAGAAAITLLSALVWKLLGKAGVEKNAVLDGLLHTYAEKAMNVAEAWAKKKADGTSGDDKMSKAVETAKALLKGTGLDKVAEEKLKAAIEAQVAKLNLDK